MATLSTNAVCKSLKHTFYAKAARQGTHTGRSYSTGVPYISVFMREPAVGAIAGCTTEQNVTENVFQFHNSQRNVSQGWGSVVDSKRGPLVFACDTTR